MRSQYSPDLEQIQIIVLGLIICSFFDWQFIRTDTLQTSASSPFYWLAFIGED